MPFSRDKVTIQLDRVTRDELHIVKAVRGFYSYNDTLLWLLHDGELGSDVDENK